MLPLGAMTQWGRIVAVGWVGERYYWCISAVGTVSMLPATVVEPAKPARNTTTGG